MHFFCGIVRCLAILSRALILFVAPLQILDIWLVKSSLLSRVIPRRVTLLSGVIDALSIWTVKSSSIFVFPKIITWHFSGFIFMPLISNQLIIMVLWFSISHWASSRDLRHIYSVLSSAKLQRSSRNRPFMKKLNNRGPKSEPWGIPMVMLTHSLKDSLTFTFCFLFHNSAHSTIVIHPTWSWNPRLLNPPTSEKSLENLPITWTQTKAALSSSLVMLSMIVNLKRFCFNPICAYFCNTV